MPRRPRVATGGYVYHALNRAAGRATIFETVGDYAAFVEVLEEAGRRVEMRLLAFCLMPNHWHLVLWPRKDGDLSEYMRSLTNTHTRRWHLGHDTVGTGPVYQGRFKSCPARHPSDRPFGSRTGRDDWAWKRRCEHPVLLPERPEK